MRLVPITPGQIPPFHPEYAAPRGATDVILIASRKSLAEANSMVGENESGTGGGSGGERGGGGGNESGDETGEGEGGGLAFYFPLDLLAKHSPFFPLPSTTSGGKWSRTCLSDNDTSRRTPETSGAAPEGDQDARRSGRSEYHTLTPHQVRRLPKPPIARQVDHPASAPPTPRTDYEAQAHAPASDRGNDDPHSAPSIHFSTPPSSTPNEPPTLPLRPRGPRPLPTPPSTASGALRQTMTFGPDTPKIMSLSAASPFGLLVVLDAILLDEGLAPRRNRAPELVSLHPRDPSPASPSVSSKTSKGRSDRAIASDADSGREDEDGDGVSTIAPSSYRATYTPEHGHSSMDITDPLSPSLPPNTSRYNSTSVAPLPRRSYGNSVRQDNHNNQSPSDAVALSTASSSAETRLLASAYTTARVYSFPLRLIFDFLDVGEENPWVGYALAALSHSASPPPAAAKPRVDCVDVGLDTPTVLAGDSASDTNQATSSWIPSREMRHWSTRSLAYHPLSLPVSVSALLREHSPTALTRLEALHAAWEPFVEATTAALLEPPRRLRPLPFPRSCRSTRLRGTGGCDAEMRFGTYSMARYETGRIVWHWLLLELGGTAPLTANGEGARKAEHHNLDGEGSWKPDFTTAFVTPLDLDQPLQEIVTCTPCRKELVWIHFRAIRHRWPGHPGHAAWGQLPMSV